MTREALKDIAKIVQFAFMYPSSFRNANLWARKEISRAGLTALADSEGTDKGLQRHMYTRVYDDLFSARRTYIKYVLELGLLVHAKQRRIRSATDFSAPSLNMWSSYFPEAKVFGLDNKNFSSASGPRTPIIQADQGVRDELEQVTAVAPYFDIIIDDALHASYHQQVSFSYLFSIVSGHGFYVFEDLHYQPEWAETRAPVGKTLAYLEMLNADGIWRSPVASPSEKEYIEKHVDSITFFDSMERGMGSARALAIVRKVGTNSSSPGK